MVMKEWARATGGHASRKLPKLLVLKWLDTGSSQSGSSSGAQGPSQSSPALRGHMTRAPLGRDCSRGSVERACHRTGIRLGD
jgi:hypothetical protein